MLYTILLSTEMIASNQILLILHIAICLPTRLFAENPRNLAGGEYDFSYFDGGKPRFDRRII